MPTESSLPNVILIVLDTARADAFEPYGAAKGATPTVAQLASSGATHRKAIASSNWTMPSHVSMLTGLLPRTAGLSKLPEGDQKNCRVVLESHQERLLPEVLRRAGYRTAGASTNLWVSTRLGFATGFDEFRNLVGKRVKRMHDPSLKGRVRWYAQALLSRIDDGMTAVEGQMDRWMAAAQRPFFWFVNLIECHSPYIPPRPYNDLGPTGRLKAAADARRFQTLFGVWRCCATGVPPPRESLDRMRLLYDRSVTMMDDWLARLCEKLDRRGLLKDTLVVITSDHGENFGEGGLFGHAVSLDDRLLWVPLVLAGPGASSSDGGVTSLADLPRLIADGIGLEDHPWEHGDSQSRVAIAQYDVGIDGKDPRLSIFHEWGATPEGLRRFIEPGTCATDGRYKLVTLGAEEWLYDVATDPLEVSPLRADTVPADVVALLRAALDRSRETEWTPDLTRLRERLPTAPEATADSVKDLEDRMRLLGYL